MKTATKVWLIVAASLILLGGVGVVGVMSWNRWNFKLLSTSSYETNTHTVEEDFENISLKTDTADIIFALSEDGVCRVECYETAKVKYTVSVENGTLCVDTSDNRRWYEYIGVNWASPRVTVYLPESEYGTLVIRSSTGDVEIPEKFLFRSMDITLSTGHTKNYASVTESMKIKASTGDILVENVSAETVNLSVRSGKVDARAVTCSAELTLSVSTGRTRLSNVTCGSLVSSGDTGDLTLSRVTAVQRMAVERSTGDVTLESCDAGELLIRTDTGDVKGSLLSEKIFMAQTDTGRVSVPKTVSGGVCEIRTDTGDIVIHLVNP